MRIKMLMNIIHLQVKKIICLTKIVMLLVLHLQVSKAVALSNIKINVHRCTVLFLMRCNCKYNKIHPILLIASELTHRCHKSEFATRVKLLRCRILNQLHDNLAQKIYYTHRIHIKMHANIIDMAITECKT